MFTLFDGCSVHLVGGEKLSDWPCGLPGDGQVLATLLFAVAVPILIGCLLFAGGILLLIPVLMIGAAVGSVKTLCNKRAKQFNRRS